MSLATKYRPQSFADVTEQGNIEKIMENICKHNSPEEFTNRCFLFIGPAGTGKAQPLYSKILTPTGWITMGDIKIGDKVFTARGNIGKVSEIYPQGKRPCYRITFQDKTHIDVADNHLNCVWWYNEDKKQRIDQTLTTLDLIKQFNHFTYDIKSNRRIRVDLPSVDWKYSKPLMNPYLVGALLGDGSLSSNSLGFSNSESDVISKVDSILRSDYNYYLKDSGNHIDYTISPLHSNSEHISKLRNDLSELDICRKSVDKHIPSVYLFNDISVRTQILQGLFDTDGSVEQNSPGITTSFSTSSKQLSEDFAFLVRSLGIRDTITECKDTHYTDASGEIHYSKYSSFNHYLKIPSCITFCSSEKHRKRLQARQNEPLKNIESIEYIGDIDCQCIMVDHPDHTYISDDFIPTHNTTTARIMAKALNNGEGEPIEIDAASNNTNEATKKLIDAAQSYPIVGTYKIFIIDEAHALSQASWQTLLKSIEEPPARSVFIFATTDPEKIPATIISRVQVFQLSKISVSGITNRLKYICDSEISEGKHITYDKSTLQYIAKLANGGMRDAITNLDKALAYSDDLNMSNIQIALGLPHYDDFFDLLQACVSRDNTKIAEIVNRVYDSGINFIQFFEKFHSFSVQIIKYILLQDINETTIPNTYEQRISHYTVKHANICLQLARKLMDMNRDLKRTNYLQETALTHLLTVKKSKPEEKN